jgi:OFA family oxalate/formate antiporter-like MFS transporter
MMGFGISTLIMGKVASTLFANPNFGMNKTYILIGVILAVVLILAGIILRKPSQDDKLPSPKASKSTRKEAFESRDFTTSEMLKSFTFWRAFVFMALLTAVGNSVISFAKGLTLSVNASENLAVTLVGVLSVFNGIGRILTGAIYDALGRRTTMILANILTIVAAGVTLVAVQLGSLPVCIIGLCLTGLSYGSCPTLTSAFTSSFYGQKYFSVNYSLTNFNLIVAAFIAKFSNTLLEQSGAYTASFVMLLALAVCALGLNFSIKKP